MSSTETGCRDSPRRKIVAALVVAALLAAAAPRVGGAQLVLRPGASSLCAGVLPTALNPSVAFVVGDSVSHPHRPTYWQEGGLLGGFTLGFAVGAFAGGLCGDTDSGATGPCWDNVLLGALLGAGSGLTLGALVGGLIQKPERSYSDTTQIR
jgi:MFS family permease